MNTLITAASTILVAGYLFVGLIRLFNPGPPEPISVTSDFGWSYDAHWKRIYIGPK